MKRLGTLFLAAGVAWLVMPVMNGACATDPNKTQTRGSVKVPSVKAPSKPTVRMPVVKTPAKPVAKAPAVRGTVTGRSGGSERTISGKPEKTRLVQGTVTGQSKPSGTARTTAGAAKPEGKYPATGGFYEGVKWDKKGHVPQGTYVGDDGRLHYFSKVTPYKPPAKTAPQTPTTVEGWPTAQPSAVGDWQPGRPYDKPSGHVSTGSESLNWSSQQGGKRPSSAKTSSSWGGAPPPNPAKGKSGVPYAKPADRTSTSGEVVK